MTRPSAARVTIHLLFCSFLSHVASSPSSTSDPAPPQWDGNAISEPQPGWLFQHDQTHILVTIDVSHLKDVYSQDWGWSLWWNDVLLSTLDLSTDLRTSLSVQVPSPGRHEIHVRLKAGMYELVGIKVPLYVDFGSSFARLDNAAKSRLAEKREAFLKWVQTHGEGFTKLRIEDDGYGGSALRATHDLEKGEVIGVMPLSMTFSPDGVVRASSMQGFFKNMYAASTKVPESLATAMFMLKEVEAGNASFFAPFLDLLPPPSKIDNALYWDAEFEDLVSFSPGIIEWARDTKEIFDKVHRIKQQNVEALESFKRDVPDKDLPLFALQPLKWALALILTRSWHFDGRSQLVPLADLANHVSILPRNTGTLKVRFDKKKRHIEMSIENGRVKAGTEIVWKYGSNDNSHLVARYGFATWPNPDHSVPLLPSVSDKKNAENVAVCENGGTKCAKGRLPGLTREAWKYHRARVLTQARAKGWGVTGRVLSTWPTSADIQSAVAGGEKAVGGLMLELLTLRGIRRSIVRAAMQRDRAVAKCREASAESRMQPLKQMACTFAEKERAILTETTEQVRQEWQRLLRALKELACRAKFGDAWMSSAGWCGEDSSTLKTVET